jgi:Tfp pilus assembly protein PilN
VAFTQQKRQREFKKMEKQREKAERRAQKKIAKREEKERGGDPLAEGDQVIVPEGEVVTP